MELENRLSIINTNLDKAIMEISGTTQRDLLLEAQIVVKKTIWHIKKDKQFDKDHPGWRD